MFNFLQTNCRDLHVSFGMKKWSTLLTGLCFLQVLSAQTDFIQWSNPSFEDIPGPGRPPLGWYFCGPPEETPPDVHPVGIMNVTQKAKHGKTYAGLVVRDNNTQETLGQSLSQPLLSGQCYFFRLYACHSNSFSSYSRINGEPLDFSQPIRLQVWMGSQHCQREILLAETPAIQDTVWQDYEVQINPPKDCNQLFFSATYDETAHPYNGHLLIDHLSPIVAVDCNEENLPAGQPTAYDVDVLPDNLAELILAQLPGVQWVRAGFSLRQELFPSAEAPKKWISGNPAIFRISEYLKAQPGALLTVAVGPRKDPLVQHHIRLLAAEFMAAGLPPDRCLIRPLKKRDLKRADWLNALLPGTDLLWGVSLN